MPTPLETPDRTFCVSGGWNIVSQGISCASVTPLDTGYHQYKLQNTKDDSVCLDSNNASVFWSSCNLSTVKIWSDLDPFGRGLYPDSYFRFPISYNDGVTDRCLERASTATNAPVYVAPCSSFSQNQLWTDGWKFQPGANNAGDVFGVAAAYNYAPSQVGDRIFWCAGIGVDAIVNWQIGSSGSAVLRKENLAALPVKSGLVCDPHPVKTSSGYRVYVTQGNTDPLQNGLNGNGVSYYDFDNAGKRIGTNTPKTILPVTARGSYGNGQPSVTPDGANWLMAYRNDGTSPGQIKLKTLDASGTVVTGSPSFTAEEVATQPDIFLRNGKLYNLVTGSGWATIRTYVKQANGNYSRETSLENNEGNLPGRTKINLNGTFDGAGLKRGTDNLPAINPDGSVGIVWAIPKNAEGANFIRQAGAISVP